LAKFSSSDIFLKQQHEISKTVVEKYMQDYKSILTKDFYNELVENNPVYQQKSYEEYRKLCSRIYPLLYFISVNKSSSSFNKIPINTRKSSLRKSSF